MNLAMPACTHLVRWCFYNHSPGSQQSTHSRLVPRWTCQKLRMWAHRCSFRHGKKKECTDDTADKYRRGFLRPHNSLSAVLLRYSFHDDMFCCILKFRNISYSKLPNSSIWFEIQIEYGIVRFDIWQFRIFAQPFHRCWFAQVDSIEDEVQKSLNKIRSRNFEDVPDAQKQDLKKRKLLCEV